MKPTFGQRLRYQFDNLMSRGTPALIGMLFVLSLVIVLVSGAVITIAGLALEDGTEPLSFGEAAWAHLRPGAGVGVRDVTSGAQRRSMGMTRPCSAAQLSAAS